LLSNCFQFWYKQFELVTDLGARMQGKITKTSVDRLEPWTVLWDTDVKGFGVRRNGADGRHYLLRYRFGGKQTFRKIGRHGSPFTPDTARNEARRLLGLLATGVHPAAQAPQSEDFASEVERYLTHKQGLKAYAMVERHLRKHAAPLHRLRFGEIDRRTIAQVLAGIERTAGPIARNRTRASLSAFFSWLIREGLIDTNPVAGTGKADEGPSRDRVLSGAELAEVWHAATGTFGDIIRLLILTGQRRNEIGFLRWSEVDWGRKMIVFPPERTKNKLRHELPLASQALAILQQRRTKVGGDHVFREFNWYRGKLALDARLKGVAPWRIHDLRRTCATGLQRLGVRLEVTEAVLNHISGSRAGIVGIYQRHDFADEKRLALQRWADHVEALIIGPRKQPVPIGLMERAFAVARGGKIVPEEELANLARQLKNNVTN
jgi:integrase